MLAFPEEESRSPLSLQVSQGFSEGKRLRDNEMVQQVKYSVSCRSGCPQTCYVVKVSLDLMIFLSLHFKNWD